MFFRILQIAIPFMWFGAVGAISFMEAPLKFTAPNITLALGLGIGRIVFQTLNKIELVMAVLLIFSVLMQRPKGRSWLYFLGIAGLLLFLETIWVLPALDVRALQVLSGEAPPFSNGHLIYIAFDAIKLLSLFCLGIILAKQRINEGQRNFSR
ncbi:MAG TPA: hypothetical protein PKY82_01275 [Pyrinomonadaceae bacterium]|nr:hypothetical protein [Pyrinomonadaceae bacterium]